MVISNRRTSIRFWKLEARPIPPQFVSIRNSDLLRRRDLRRFLIGEVSIRFLVFEAGAPTLRLGPRPARRFGLVTVASVVIAQNPTTMITHK